ncbi:uncharacterized protein [Triticum aestivum]|uniref:uncharacterized protein n=1 Tax=Triticum aestivum TaxID=4565 RepID=UPI001D006272|nr:uncharacterized protein LOC123075885 [Triticum aestivum]
MTAIRSLAWKIGGRALQRSPVICPAVKVEHELLLRMPPHVVKSRLFSSGGSDTGEPLCKNCLHSFTGPAADARSHLNNLGPKGLREEVEKKKKDLLYALLKMDSCTNLSAFQGENREELGVLLPLLQPKTQQPRLEELLDRPMKFCIFVICAAPIVAVLCVYRNSTRPFAIDEE